MHNVELNNLYCLSGPGVSQNSGKVGKECGMHGSEGNLEKIFDWKIGRKGSIQKALRIWEENIAVDFKELYQGVF